VAHHKILGVPQEIFAGLLLAFAAVAGVVFENIPLLTPYYDALLNVQTTVAVGEAKISKALLLWINDGLMAVFFLFVAVEIKREIRMGALSSWQTASLPVYGAIGGIVVPSLVFLGIVGVDSAEAAGWAIPAATDIAFALGVLSLFGKRVPPILKTVLLTLAVVDDLAAIAIIALFYTSSLSMSALMVAVIGLAALLALNLLNVRSGVPFVLVGVILWVAVLKSGVHATLAGVALGFAVPLQKDAEGHTLSGKFEHNLHPWVSYMILPAFAFANAGVPLSGLSLDAVFNPLTLAVALGLFLGKQAGVFGAVYGVTRLGLAKLPDVLSWMQIYAVACLAGIGFTMSLFIGGLAFGDPAQQNLVRIGVITGSLLSGLLGSAILAFAKRPEPKAEGEVMPAQHAPASALLDAEEEDA